MSMASNALPLPAAPELSVDELETLAIGLSVQRLIETAWEALDRPEPVPSAVETLIDEGTYAPSSP